MKNVANCDTWCELQNPVNHRVFERKLRPTLEGTFAWVSHMALPLIPRLELAGGTWVRMLASRDDLVPVGPKSSAGAISTTTSGG